MARAEMWEKIDADTQRRIDDLLIEVRGELKAAGFPATGSRFPYAIHHEFYRVRIRVLGRKAQHAEIATMLNRWMATRSDKIDYVRQAICGSVKSMLASRPELAGRIPASARAAMGSVGDGYDFLSWSKTYVAERPLGVLPEEPVIDRDQMIDELIDAVSGPRQASNGFSTYSEE